MRFLIALLLVATALLGPRVDARNVHDRQLAEVGVDELPPEARHTLALIRRGGPFPYRKDATVFGNRERLLPVQSRGYYTEYTVKTPHLRNRGPRRIVAGRGSVADPATSGEYYYTDDHYSTFRRIRE